MSKSLAKLRGVDLVFGRTNALWQQQQLQPMAVLFYAPVQTSEGAGHSRGQTKFITDTISSTWHFPTFACNIPSSFTEIMADRSVWKMCRCVHCTEVWPEKNIHKPSVATFHILQHHPGESNMPHRSNHHLDNAQ